jgi:hypothetical protein
MIRADRRFHTDCSRKESQEPSMGKEWCDRDILCRNDSDNFSLAAITGEKSHVILVYSGEDKSWWSLYSFVYFSHQYDSIFSLYIFLLLLLVLLVAWVLTPLILNPEYEDGDSYWKFCHSSLSRSSDKLSYVRCLHMLNPKRHLNISLVLHMNPRRIIPFHALRKPVTFIFPNSVTMHQELDSNSWIPGYHMRLNASWVLISTQWSVDDSL